MLYLYYIWKNGGIRYAGNFTVLWYKGKEKRKNLILTGKSGSGKTSVLEAMVKYVQSFLGENGTTTLEHAKNIYDYYLERSSRLNLTKDSEERRRQIYEANKSLEMWESILKELDSGIFLYSTSIIL